MKVIIDRFEGDFVVVELEDGNMADMPATLVPKEAKEGDVISIEIDEDDTAARKDRIEKLAAKLWKD
ncbi:MAG: DUF3006 domain-containing protein [Clostridia bacterium]|nr:DUF3006 domain-containing protein [Clostridia bacterium]